MHAYLIMAHDNFGVLEKTLKLIDDVRNDIYLHIDKKSTIDLSRLKSAVKSSRLFFAERMSVNWGDDSQIRLELMLLEYAVKNEEYEYFHLLSGVDMPIKTQDEIHRFFDNHNESEFVYFENSAPTDKVLERVRYYHFFQGRRNLFNRLMTKTETVVQRILRIDRIKGKAIQKGANWFSITGDFASFTVYKKNELIDQFKDTLSGDEFFIQTLIINSQYRDKLYIKRFDNSNEQNMRYVDWDRGSPYTFTEEDFDVIMESGMFFVRKLTDDNKLPDMIYEAVKTQQG